MEHRSPAASFLYVLIFLAGVFNAVVFVHKLIVGEGLSLISVLALASAVLGLVYGTRGIRSQVLRPISCRFGKHVTASGSQPNNFCPECGSLIRPAAFKTFEASLKDGTRRRVLALSPAHAEVLVVHGLSASEDAAVYDRTRQSKCTVVVHPSNITEIKEVVQLEGTE